MRFCNAHLALYVEHDVLALAARFGDKLGLTLSRWGAAGLALAAPLGQRAHESTVVEKAAEYGEAGTF